MEPERCWPEEVVDADGMGDAQPPLLAARTAATARGWSSSSTSSCRSPHSTKQFEDTVAWALDTEPEAMIAEREGRRRPDAARRPRSCAGGCRCPVLVIHGTDDRCQPLARGRRVAELTGGELVVLDGSGHLPHVRDPVRVNRLIIDFVEETTGVAMRTKVWSRGLSRPKRALYLSSPIGLGHARRDVAVAKELKRLRPDLEIDWLAQHPVTAVLEAEGETHPPGEPVARQRVGAHRFGVERARPSLLPGAAPDGRDPGRQLHGVPGGRRRRAATT